MSQQSRPKVPVPADACYPGLLAVDATNVLYRCFHAMQSSGMSHAGRPVWAVHGLLTYLAKWIRLLEPSDVVLAFDHLGGCPHRRSLLPSYKASRPSPASTLAYQLDWAPSLCRQLGFSVAQLEGWEADDILASSVEGYVARREGAVGDVVVVSSDRDVYQLISERVSVMSPDDNWTTLSTLHERMGLTPGQYVQFAALRGEPGDGIPGVPGVGPKKASSLISRFGSVANALAAPSGEVHRLVGRKSAESLFEFGPQALLALEVSALNSSLHVDLPSASLDRLDVDRVRSICTSSGLSRAGDLLSSALASSGRCMT